MLSGKKILLGVSGSIAAYKACELASGLVKLGAEVQVIMTEGAREFVAPLTFQTLTGRPVTRGLFDEVKQWKVEHIGAAQWCDAFLVAPATANVIAKFAAGIADDSLSATWLACGKPKLLAPAMNTAMYENPVTQENLAKLKRLGVLFAEPASGLLACGDVGKGKLAESRVILDWLEYALEECRPLDGRKVVVSAGPTQEAIDPVRFLTNHSSGRMGYAIAKEAWLMGAEVTLVSGPTGLAAPAYCEVKRVKSAAEMAAAVKEAAKDAHIIVKSAAVADYRPATVAEQKIKKGGGDLSLELTRTEDILKSLGRAKKPGQVLVGFAAETQDLLSNAGKKLREKNADIIAANDLTREGAGFGGDTNILTLLFAGGKTLELPKLSKEAAARRLLTEAAALL